jgi:uncharacterized protein (TIGR02996 family)
VKNSERLLRAVLTDPSDDLARLAYADALEEEGDDARAAFVRVQVELAGLEAIEHDCGPDGEWEVTCPACGASSDIYELRARQDELLALRCPKPGDNRRRADDWASGGGWQAVTHGGGPFWLYPPPPHSHTGHDFAFGRGLTDAVCCPLEVWLEHGPALCDQQPVTRAEISNKRPDRRPGGQGDRAGVWWEPGLSYQMPYQLPFAICESAGWRPSFVGGLMVYKFKDEDAAISALSLACVNYARNYARLKNKLPPLEAKP